MNVKRPQILLVNDDGIRSPGLWAAAEALSTLGFVTVIAPRIQFSGAGRSMANGADGSVEPTQLKIGSQDWTTYSVNGSPAQATQIGIHEIIKGLPDLIVSGINYGENPSHDITMSGTVGAAIEGAAHGVPALAVSLELENEEWFSYSTAVDFSTAAFFTHKFAQILLTQPTPADVDLLNLNVPAKATPATPWKMTRLSRNRYFNPFLRPAPSDQQNPIDSVIRFDPNDPNDQDSDVHAFKVEKLVSVTPLSLDMTSRVDLKVLEEQFKSH
jgi:5'-nucleotidase